MSNFVEDTEWIFKSARNSGLLVAKTCYVKSFFLSPKADVTSWGEFKDDLTGATSSILILRTAVNQTFSHNFDIPLFFGTGCYVYMSANAHIMTIQYKEDV